MKCPESIECVLSDFDGTAVKPLEIDFLAARKAVDAFLQTQPNYHPKDTSLFEWIDACAAGNRQIRRKALDIVDTYENVIMDQAAFAEGFVAFREKLAARRIPLGIVTNNCRGSVEYMFTRHNVLKPEVIASRDDVMITKPNVAHWKPITDHGIILARAVYIGDTNFDAQLGEGRVHTVMIKSSKNKYRGDVEVASFQEFVEKYSPAIFGDAHVPR